MVAETHTAEWQTRLHRALVRINLPKQPDEYPSIATVAEWASQWFRLVFHNSLRCGRPPEFEHSRIDESDCVRMIRDHFRPIYRTTAERGLAAMFEPSNRHDVRWRIDDLEHLLTDYGTIAPRAPLDRIRASGGRPPVSLFAMRQHIQAEIESLHAIHDADEAALDTILSPLPPGQRLFVKIIYRKPGLTAPAIDTRSPRGWVSENAIRMVAYRLRKLGVRIESESDNSGYRITREAVLEIPQLIEKRRSSEV